VLDAAEPRAFVDLHCHSSASFDSLTSPATIVRLAAERGLTHQAITDHERLDGALRARDLAPAGLTIIVGEEVRTTGGDMLGLYLTEPVSPGMTPLETAEAIHEQGGLVGLPHPFDRFRGSAGSQAVEDALAELAASIDFVEAFNARVPFGSANRRAADFAVAHGLPGVASSDAHSPFEIGIAYTMFDADITDAASLRAALPDGELVMGRASLVARALAPAVKTVQRLRGNRRVRAGAVPGTTADIRGHRP
jgi:predicted metal-dependent phosphoesterase TrpH